MLHSREKQQIRITFSLENVIAGNHLGRNELDFQGSFIFKHAEFRTHLQRRALTASRSF